MQPLFEEQYACTLDTQHGKSKMRDAANQLLYLARNARVASFTTQSAMSAPALGGRVEVSQVPCELQIRDTHVYHIHGG